MHRVFQIGFNKCGTRTLARGLKSNGVETAHWNWGRLARSIKARVDAGEDPILDFPGTVAFTDMEDVFNPKVDVQEDGSIRVRPLVEAYRYFREFHEWHSEAYFILNTRPLEDWIKSRVAHANGRYIEAYRQHYGYRDPASVVERWREEWQRHHEAVRSHFRGHDRFLEWDIRNTKALTDFLPWDFEPDTFAHKGKTEEHKLEAADGVICDA